MTDRRSSMAGEKQALVLLHGFLGAGEDWHALAKGLESGFTCLTPDLPGHGANLQADCSFEASADQLWTWLDGQGIDKLDLVGYSMGARLALYLVCTQPERIGRCVLESGSPGLDEQGERVARRAADEKLAQKLLDVPLERFLADWYSQPLFAGLRQMADFEDLLQRRLKNRPEGLACSLRQAGTGSAPSQWGALADLNTPILYLAGQDDAKFRDIGNQMARLCPSMRRQILPGGHCLNQESPSAWLDAVGAFLQR